MKCSQWVATTRRAVGTFSRSLWNAMCTSASGSTDSVTTMATWPPATTTSRVHSKACLAEVQG